MTHAHAHTRTLTISFITTLAILAALAASVPAHAAEGESRSSVHPSGVRPLMRLHTQVDAFLKDHPDATREDVHAWLEANKPTPPTVAEIEARLTERLSDVQARYPEVTLKDLKARFEARRAHMPKRDLLPPEPPADHADDGFQGIELHNPGQMLNRLKIRIRK